MYYFACAPYPYNQHHFLSESGADTILEQIKAIFSVYKEAVFVIKGKKLAYYNPAAERLVPGINALAINDIFPDEILAIDDDNFAGEIDINSARATYSASRLGSYRVISVLSADSAKDDIDAAMLLAITDELKNYLTVFKTASDNVLMYVESFPPLLERIIPLTEGVRKALNHGSGGAEDGGVLAPFVKNALPLVEQASKPHIAMYSSALNKSYYNIYRLLLNAESLINDTGGRLVKQYFDLAEVCRTLVQMSDDMASDSGVTLSFKCELDTLPVCADENKIVQLIMNMLSNSYRHTPPGGSISLKLTKTDKKALIKLTDTGTGMPMDGSAAIWHKYKTPKGKSDIARGAGLGFAVMSKIAREHDGNIYFMSGTGKGMSVSVSISLEPDGGGSTVMSTIERYRVNDREAVFTGLSTVVGSEKYLQKYMD